MVEAKPTEEGHENEEEVSGDDVYFDPIITLPLIEVSTNEEDEMEMIKLFVSLSSTTFLCPGESKCVS